MPLSQYLSQIIAIRGRFLVILVVHIPIILIAVGMLPTLLIAAPIFPSRYEAFLTSILQNLMQWSCSALAGNNMRPEGASDAAQSCRNEEPATRILAK